MITVETWALLYDSADERYLESSTVKREAYAL